MKRAIDYSYGFGGGTPARLAAEHIEVVVRYVGQPSWSKCLTTSEAKALRAHGIGIGFVYETSATWMLGGNAAGIAAGNEAKRHVRSIGGPADPFVYLAADFEMQPAHEDAVLACLRGAAAVLGQDRVGVYGGYATVKAALAHHAAAKAWQTLAWSYGRWHPDAVLRQTSIAPATPFGSLGVDYDADEMMSGDVGQWGYVKPKPPEPKPPTPPKPAGPDYRPLKIAAVQVAKGLRIAHAGVVLTAKGKGAPFEKLLVAIADHAEWKVDYRPLKAEAVKVADTLKIAHAGVDPAANELGAAARALLKAIAAHR